MTQIFLTGATGFLGRHLAVRLLARTDVDRLWCLVRAEDRVHGQARLARSLGRVGAVTDLDGLLESVETVVGDLTLPRMGLSPERWAAVAGACTVFVHGAANVRFDQSLDEAREHNLGGTRRVVELAREVAVEGRLERLDWIGTTFVAGLRRDRALESELEHQEGWKNSYEQSKYEAEAWLRSECGDLPVTVFRPSIIVGESHSGATTNFGMLYWPIQVYSRGWWRTVVGRPDTPVDIVPVDFVADAVVAMTRPGRGAGGTYHLAAGPEGCLTIGELAEICQRFFDGPAVRYMAVKTFMTWLRPVVDAFLWGKKGRVLKDGGRFFVPYMDGNPVFDVTESARELAELGVPIPGVRQYFETLLRYALDTDFGRRPPGGSGDDGADLS